jgi:hypothetical protein
VSSAAPWDGEPDDFSMIASGLPVRGHRHEFFRHWCGYVGVPKSHPLFRHSFKDPVPHPAGLMDRPFAINEVGGINLLGMLLMHHTWGEGYAPVSLIFTVHGGLSFSGHFQDDLEHWYFGFDCGHAGDLQPGMLDAHIEPEWYHRISVYRTMEFVMGECVQLAEQVAQYGKQAVDEVTQIRTGAGD